MDPKIMKAVVGVLTVGGEWARTLELGDDGDVDLPPGEEHILRDLIREVFPPLEFDADATMEEVAPELSATLGASLTALCGAFMMAFNDLAAAHQDCETGKTTADVLRRLALEADNAS